MGMLIASATLATMSGDMFRSPLSAREMWLTDTLLASESSFSEKPRNCRRTRRFRPLTCNRFIMLRNHIDLGEFSQRTGNLSIIGFLTGTKKGDSPPVHPQHSPQIAHLQHDGRKWEQFRTPSDLRKGRRFIGPPVASLSTYGPILKHLMLGYVVGGSGEGRSFNFRYR